MYGFVPNASEPFASLEGRIHALVVVDGAQGVSDGALGVRIAMFAQEGTSGYTQDLGQNGNTPSVLAQTQSSAVETVLTALPLVAADSAQAADFGRIVLSEINLHASENVLAEDAPPFARQKWEFVPTTGGGAWVLVRTGE